MYMTGQPIHFFDAEKITGDIIIRDAEEGEAFSDLLGNDHILTPNDIVIADQQ